jgi:hypothetical protein
MEKSRHFLWRFSIEVNESIARQSTSDVVDGDCISAFHRHGQLLIILAFEFADPDVAVADWVAVILQPDWAFLRMWLIRW